MIGLTWLTTVLVSMRHLFLASIMVFIFPYDAIASCELESKMLNQAKMDAEILEDRINFANYEEGIAGNERCRLLRQYIYLRERHSHRAKKWVSCLNISVVGNTELSRHLEELQEIKGLYGRKCYGEK